jgi:hypothetical protein
MAWLISAICASGQMPQMTPFMAAAKPSLRPKSVVRVIMGIL